MDRRTWIGAMVGGLVLPPAARAAEGGPLLLGAAWRGPRDGDPHHVGVLEADWARAEVRIRHAQPVPSRPHGLLAEADGALVAVALRPGAWIQRSDARGRLMQRVGADADGGRTTFGGHAAASLDGRWLYTTETETSSGEGRIGVRDAATLRKVDEWPSHGIEPHQLLIDPDGHVVIAHGGIRRGPGDAKRELERMDPSFVRLDGRTGVLLGRWRLADPRLSIRHMAWSGEGGERRLGLALQAEHDDPARRVEAPALAVWDGNALRAATRHAGAMGHAGDIAPAAGGGFVISHAKAQRVWWWRPDAPDELTVVARLAEAYALAASDGGAVVVAAARGVGRWHPAEPAALLPWPQPMALDNHWVAWV